MVQWHSIELISVVFGENVGGMDAAVSLQGRIHGVLRKK
jgi:hypothetical protein